MFSIIQHCIFLFRTRVDQFFPPWSIGTPAQTESKIIDLIRVLRNLKKIQIAVRGFHVRSYVICAGHNEFLERYL